MLSQRQSRLGGNGSLDGRVVSQGKKKCNIVQYTTLLKAIREETGYVMLDTHGCKHNAEIPFTSSDFCLTGNLCGELVVIQAVSAENRKFLTLNQCCHAINN